MRVLYGHVSFVRVSVHHAQLPLQQAPCKHRPCLRMHTRCNCMGALLSTPHHMRFCTDGPTGHARRGGAAGGRQQGQADCGGHLSALRLCFHRRGDLFLHPGTTSSRTLLHFLTLPRVFLKARRPLLACCHERMRLVQLTVYAPDDAILICWRAGDRAAGDAHHVRGAAVQHVAGAGGAERQPGAQAVQAAARGARPLRRPARPAGAL